MKRSSFLPAILGAALAFGMTISARAETLIQVTPWLAPNVYGSPSFPGAEANAVQGLYQGLTSFGTPGTPTYFKAQTTPVTSNQVIVTGFPSWLGQVDPGTVFGPGFASELGNRMHFGLSAIGSDGQQFSISQMSFNAVSTDPFNALNFGFAASAYNYGTGYMGVLYGGDNALGGGDDTFITGGLNTQLVDAIFGRGSGNSFAAYCPALPLLCTLVEQQAALDDAAAYPGGPFKFTGTYTIGAYSGSGTFDINPVPIPGAALLFGSALAGLAGLSALRRRKKSEVLGLTPTAA